MNKREFVCRVVIATCDEYSPMHRAGCWAAASLLWEDRPQWMKDQEESCAKILGMDQDGEPSHRPMTLEIKLPEANSDGTA